MTVQDKAEEAVDRWLRFAREVGREKRHFVVKNATQHAMARLDDSEWTGDRDQWHEVRGLVGRIYDRRVGDPEEGG